MKFFDRFLRNPFNNVNQKISSFQRAISALDHALSRLELLQKQVHDLHHIFDEKVIARDLLEAERLTNAVQALISKYDYERNKVLEVLSEKITQYQKIKKSSENIELSDYAYGFMNDVQILSDQNSHEILLTTLDNLKNWLSVSSKKDISPGLKNQWLLAIKELKNDLSIILQALHNVQSHILDDLTRD